MKPVSWKRIGFAVLAWLVLIAASWFALFFVDPAGISAFQFRHPYLLSLLIVPLALLVLRMRIANRATPSIALPTLAALRSGPRGLRARFRDVPLLLRAVLLALGVVALARPVDFDQAETTEEQGIDIVLVLDLSGSMKAIMDDPSSGTAKGGKRPNRLDVAKGVLADFVQRRKDDRIGVIVFAKSAYVLSPPTLDHSVLLSLIGGMQLSLIDPGGTAIGDALGTAVARLRRATGRSKIVILVTDGDSNAGSVSPDTATELAAAQSVVVHTVQIGSGEEVEMEEGTDLFGQPRYVKGAPVPVNPELLKDIAKRTGGESYIASDKQSFETSMHAILDRLEKTKFKGARATARELFPLFLLAAGLFFLLEIATRAWLSRRLS